MAGHSKWAKIKHAKGIADAKKGKIFSKLAQQITVAAREGGSLDANPSLRVLVDKAKSEGLPASNIERAINKGLGVGDDSSSFEECVYEGVGPGGVSLVLDVITDNKNRVVSDLRKLFSDFGGNLSSSGSQSWNFEQKGRIEVRCGKMKEGKKHGEGEIFEKEDKEEVIMSIMDIPNIVDIEDIHDEYINVFTQVTDLHSVKNKISSLGYVVSKCERIRVPKTLKEVSPAEKEKITSLIEALEEYSDVEEIWINANL
jgi:YebC/PmpR family DNA-binding regulatory protein